MRNTRSTGNCCWLVCNPKGKAMWVASTPTDAKNWGCLHLKDGFQIKRITRKNANDEFDRQMQLGLNKMPIINALLWYGGVSTGWRGNRNSTGRQLEKIGGNE